MEGSVENMEKKDIDSLKNNSKSDIPKEVLIIAQEIKIVKMLACNDISKRNRQLRNLPKWFQLRLRSSFPLTKDDFMRIWKGLYYNMWMSDKPLVQEELAEQLSQLLDCFNGNLHYSINFFVAFMRTMCQEWFGIDQWRIDKFLMLTRRMLRSFFRVLKKSDWPSEFIIKFNHEMESTILADRVEACGLAMHYLDIFFEELAKVSNGSITAEKLNEFILPFVNYMGTQTDPKLIMQCRTRVFYHLLYQSSLGREYVEKYNAWKAMGFPTSSINDIEKIDDVETSKIEVVPIVSEHLDPRAGNVDVFMSELPFDADCIINKLKSLLQTLECNSKRRKGLRKLLQVFETYKKGVFPLGVKKMPFYKSESLSSLISKKVNKLANLENEMYNVGRKLKKLNKWKRKKFLESINFDNVKESNYEEIIEKDLSKICSLNRKKELDQMTLMNNWKEEKLVEKAKNKSSEEKSTKKALNKSNCIQANVQDFNKTSTRILSKLQWKEEPLGDVQVEYSIPSSKEKLVTNTMTDCPDKAHSTIKKKNMKKSALSLLRTPMSTSKRVKIALHHNTFQKPSDYIKMLKKSPELPFDCNKKPSKSLLKPNSLPSPINPFYKRKIALNLFHENI